MEIWNHHSIYHGEISFIFKQHYTLLYRFYCIVVYGLIRFWINIKVNFSELNRGQLGTSEFEDEKNLRKQYKVIPGSKKITKAAVGLLFLQYKEKR